MGFLTSIKTVKEYKNIQGCINAKVVRLDQRKTKAKLINYTNKLTNKQKELARDHLITVRSINKDKKRY